MSKRIIETEDHVKDLVRQWCDKSKAWHYAPIQTAMGVHGIHDRISCVPIIVTAAMVGKKIGLFVSIEAKRPGRRNEPRRGMSVHQKNHMEDIQAAGGLSICCDGEEDLAGLNHQILDLVGMAGLDLKERTDG